MPTTPNLPLSRRHFLAAAPGAVPLLRAQGRRYRTALIGSGWWGMNILMTAVEAGESEVVAICDVDQRQLDAALAKLGPLTRDQPRRYEDYRDLLAREKPEIVIVGTPDHWHALPMIAAVRAGAHVYVEKPIGHTILEGRAMVNAARSAGAVVQVGTHRRASPHNISAREFIRSGKLGKIGMVRCFVHSGGGAGKKVADAEVPAGLNWDFWLGPAPARPFNPSIHPRGFRQHLDFANGTIADWGIHWFDQVLWIMEEKYPKRVYSTAARRILADSTDAPDTQIATYDFDQFTMTWEHRRYAANRAESTAIGCYFYGEAGTLHLGWRDGWTFYPSNAKLEPIHADPKLNDPDDQNIRELWADFLDAIKNKRRALCDIEIGHYSTNVSLLGMASARAGRSLDWDGVKETITNAPEANRLLRRDYRGPWQFPKA
jgi:predicted dehydrogenase